MRNLGEITNLEVIRSLVDLQGKLVVDAGCGDMTFTRHLVELGARAVAVDPDPVQAKKNRDRLTEENIQFLETSAENIPVADRSIDGVFFSYSLHHVPAEIYPEVFREVMRILKPDGFLYVIEPIDCPLNQVMRIFHNEDRERRVAWQSITELAESRFESSETVTYHGYRQYESFEDFATIFSGKSFNTIYTEQDVWADPVRNAFEKHGAPDYRFQSPKNVIVMRSPKLLF